MFILKIGNISKKLENKLNFDDFFMNVGIWILCTGSIFKMG